MAKILCMDHLDTRPSMEIYESNGKYVGFCFVCGSRREFNNLESIGVKSVSKKTPTDIPAMIKYINDLPLTKIRGLWLHSDGRGFYIVWPDSSFYKRRNYEGKERYTGPRGVKPPLLVFGDSKDHLIIIEGELNCLTIRSYSDTPYTIASPGAASEFIRHIKEYMNYKKITIIADHDGAGVAFGLQLKEALLKEKKRVMLVTREIDYNDLLQQEGPDAVKLEFEKDIK